MKKSLKKLFAISLVGTLAIMSGCSSSTKKVTQKTADTKVSAQKKDTSQYPTTPETTECTTANTQETTQVQTATQQSYVSETTQPQTTTQQSEIWLRLSVSYDDIENHSQNFQSPIPYSEYVLTQSAHKTGQVIDEIIMNFKAKTGAYPTSQELAELLTSSILVSQGNALAIGYDGNGDVWGVAIGLTNGELNDSVTYMSLYGRDVSMYKSAYGNESGQISWLPYDLTLSGDGSNHWVVTGSGTPEPDEFKNFHS